MFFSTARYKKESNDTYLYYPNGSFGKGYIIESKNEIKKLKRFFCFVDFFSFITIGLIGAIAESFIGFAIAVMGGYIPPVSSRKTLEHKIPKTQSY